MLNRFMILFFQLGLLPLFLFCLSGETFAKAPNFFLGTNTAINVAEGALKVSRELKILLEQLKVLKETSEKLGEFNRNLNNGYSLYKRTNWLIIHVKNLSKIKPVTLSEVNSLIRRYKSAYSSGQSILRDASYRVEKYVDRSRRAEEELRYQKLKTKLAEEKVSEAYSSTGLVETASISAISDAETWVTANKTYQLLLKESIERNETKITKAAEDYQKKNSERKLKEWAKITEVEGIQKKLYEMHGLDYETGKSKYASKNEKVSEVPHD